MSKYSLAGMDPAIRVDIGWDRPLHTFFVQVFRSVDGNDELLAWEGASFAALPKASAAAAIAARWAKLPEGLTASLEINRMKTLGASDGIQQRAAHRFLRSLDDSQDP